MRPIPPPDPPLRGEGIVLRAWRADDLGDAHRASLDPDVVRFTGVPEDQDAATLAAYFERKEAARAAGEELVLVVASAAGDAFLGSVSLLRLDWDQRRGEVGYWMAPWARGRGIATAATGLLARWALAELGLERLELRIESGNAASLRVAAGAGFSRDGILRSFEERAGARRDLEVWSLLPGE